MAIPIYLAVTAGEIRKFGKLPENVAWMACHFSPYGTGITDLPNSLPPNSILILNDRTPIRGHDPNRILEELSVLVERWNISGVLADFEGPTGMESDQILSALTGLPCPLCVSQRHIGNLDLPVFLPPVPICKPVETYLKPWSGRKIWLEVARSSQKVTVTPTGATFQDILCSHSFHHQDTLLHCHYRVEIAGEAASFYLTRSMDDIESLLSQAARYGVERAVGLWQELGQDAKTAPVNSGAVLSINQEGC